SGSQELRRQEMRPSMRQKLEHAQLLIEGLANEHFDMVRDNARALRYLVGDALWRVTPNRTYVRYSGEVASIAEDLERRANEKDLNGATLSYIRPIMNCVNYPKFVRNNRIVDLRPRQN